MAQDQLTNGQYFRKHRFAELCPTSDFEVVCHGKLIKSCRQPERFYNGWYPVRHQCSFPDHKALPGAGLKSEKGLQFSCHTQLTDNGIDLAFFVHCVGDRGMNYRIICDICDHPDNRLVLDKETSCWSQLQPCRNSVAPKMCGHDVCSQSALPNVEMERAKRCRHKVDAYWRYHDPHPVASTAGLPDESRVHGSNWFKRQMANDNKYKFDQQAYSRCQRQLHLVRKDSNPAPVSQRKCCQLLAKQSTPASPQPATNVVESRKQTLVPERLSETYISQKPANV